MMHYLEHLVVGLAEGHPTAITNASYTIKIYFLLTAIWNIAPKIRFPAQSRDMGFQTDLLSVNITDGRCISFSYSYLGKKKTKN